MVSELIPLGHKQPKSAKPGDFIITPHGEPYGREVVCSNDSDLITITRIKYLPQTIIDACGFNESDPRTVVYASRCFLRGRDEMVVSVLNKGDEDYNVQDEDLRKLGI